MVPPESSLSDWKDNKRRIAGSSVHGKVMDSYAGHLACYKITFHSQAPLCSLYVLFHFAGFSCHFFVEPESA